MPRPNDTYKYLIYFFDGEDCVGVRYADNKKNADRIANIIRNTYPGVTRVEVKPA